MAQLGKYEIIEEIGRGGFGIVYKARDISLERLVALKVLHPQLTVDPSFLTRFREEARDLAKINHPNVVTIHEIGENEGRIFIAMEYLPGGSLADKIEQGPLSQGEAVKITVKAAAGLGSGHETGMVHRDVKPGNILFNQRGEAVIADYGLAKALQSSTNSVTSSYGGAVGTPYYRPPELWNGTPPPSPATDIYSLACVLYEMLTGEILFKGDTPSSVMVKHFNPISFETLSTKGLPDGLLHVLDRSLKKSPEERFQTAENFINEILSTSQGKTTPASPAKQPTYSYEEPHQRVGSKPGAAETFTFTPIKPAPQKSDEDRSGTHGDRTRLIGVGLAIFLVCVIGIAAAVMIINNNQRNTSRAESFSDQQSASLNQSDSSANEVLDDGGSEVEASTLEPDRQSAIEPSQTFTRMPEETAKPTQIKTPTTYITPTPKVYFPLSNCAASQLHLGDSAFVSYTERPNNLRSDPDNSLDNNIIGKIQPGEVVIVVGGPECSYGWMMWEVKTTRNETGWVAETNGEEFWILPLATRDICEGALPTRLVVGGKAKVCEEPPDRNIVRVGPSRFDGEVGRIDPGAWMRVLEGPVCGEKANWWKVESLDEGITGWTLEGNLDYYYLAPEP